MGRTDRANSNAGPGVCIIVENNTVPPDRRVWREARALTASGYRVCVICPKGRGFERSHETIDGIEIYRHSLWTGSGFAGYFVEYTWALLMEFILAVRLCFRYRFRILHACNPPDNIFLIALALRLFGVRFVFDQHDPFPEFFEARFGRGGIVRRFVELAEKWTFRAAHATIVTNESCRDLAVGRGGVSPNRCFVVRNCPSLKDFPPRPAQPELKRGFRHMVVYVGIMGSQDGINLLVDSVRHIVQDKGRRDTLFVLIGPGPEAIAQESRANALGLQPWIHFTGPLYGDDLRAYMATADVGVSPDPINVFNDKITMIKIFEYMACGLPVVLYDLQEGRKAAGGAALYAKDNSPIDLAEQIDQLLESEPLRRRLGEIGKERILSGLNWESETKSLLAAYDVASA
ncbi:MAG: glycosyltransferase family 4 protein [Bryobacteraceae bacterium]